ncbi:hypothetical protein DFA_11217 [Cavenderia fasciculata]|uniref:Uncharacterized protein n=1 Tax=Cavenderia fasciculata TaxID=261658 RepID=F4QFK3_CACFS|nr:uncharacterized protein DFA_11217 [Cavenderia fasciculata]EGG13456.1 hypothetical protein DFA_11217 [Cavenderia fasciculata]|eukprot:XP_004350160.1 hypothetical protein DFA_11217 [Cavenderia fasciculata]
MEKKKKKKEGINKKSADITIKREKKKLKEYNGVKLELDGDIGSNQIENDSVLFIVTSSDIIHVHAIPSWNTEEREIYALDKQTTLLSKLFDSFLAKYKLHANKSTLQMHRPAP